MIESTRDELAELLMQREEKVVFAESCTGGLVAATMAQVNGVSNHLCGSAVTYRPDLKQHWLAVDAESIEAHTCESREVVELMARGVLERALEANWAAAVVGHLTGECFAWVAIGHRRAETIQVVACARYELRAKSRVARQAEAAEIVLRDLVSCLRQSTDD
ncbi:MAG: CinA family protein [Pirellulaceae bacterium]|nr:CinA family protein [Pirellulaceae bacterium]MDP7016554.1 CinA family protein [Pirellulaceae bacterium]